MMVLDIFNDYFQKIPIWKEELVTSIKKQDWDTDKKEIALRILEEVDYKKLNISSSIYPSPTEIFFSYQESSIHSSGKADALDLFNYILDICQNINSISQHLRFDILNSFEHFHDKGIKLFIIWKF